MTHLGLISVLAMSSALVQQDSNQGSRPLTFGATTSMGGRMFISDMVKDGPAFIYFIREGDGVNAQFARQLNRIHAKYPTRKIKWFGVTNADPARAKAWVAEFGPRYQVLMDESLSMPQLYGVDSSPALVLVGQDGNPIKKWSGFSGFWLKDINKTLAEHEGVPMKYIDFNMTPSTTQYGVRYILPEKG